MKKIGETSLHIEQLTDKLLAEGLDPSLVDDVLAHHGHDKKALKKSNKHLIRKGHSVKEKYGPESWMHEFFFHKFHIGKLILLITIAALIWMFIEFSFEPFFLFISGLNTLILMYVFKGLISLSKNYSFLSHQDTKIGINKPAIVGMLGSLGLSFHTMPMMAITLYGGGTAFLTWLLYKELNFNEVGGIVLGMAFFTFILTIVEVFIAQSLFSII